MGKDGLQVTNSLSTAPPKLSPKTTSLSATPAQTCSSSAQLMMVPVSTDQFSKKSTPPLKLVCNWLGIKEAPTPALDWPASIRSMMIQASLLKSATTDQLDVLTATN